MKLLPAAFLALALNYAPMAPNANYEDITSAKHIPDSTKCRQILYELNDKGIAQQLENRYNHQNEQNTFNHAFDITAYFLGVPLSVGEVNVHLNHGIDSIVLDANLLSLGSEQKLFAFYQDSAKCTASQVQNKEVFEYTKTPEGWILSNYLCDDKKIMSRKKRHEKIGMSFPKDAMTVLEAVEKAIKNDLGDEVKIIYADDVQELYLKKSKPIENMAKYSVGNLKFDKNLSATEISMFLYLVDDISMLVHGEGNLVDSRWFVPSFRGSVSILPEKK